MNYPKLTLSMTTCKRFPLFKSTIESFFENCLDRNLISEIVIVDDNSDKIEVENMGLTLFHIFERYGINIKYRLITKDESEKGHPKSLRLLFDNVNSDYILMLEDDWLSIKKDHYIKKAFDIMKYDNSISQVLFRHNDEIMAVNQEEKNYNYIRYVKYHYDGVGHNDLSNRVAWPGWNLNPSLLNMKEFKKHGNVPDIYYFEYYHSRALWRNGFKVAYFVENYFSHIGGNNSAYKINNTDK